MSCRLCRPKRCDDVTEMRMREDQRVYEQWMGGYSGGVCSDEKSWRCVCVCVYLYFSFQNDGEDEANAQCLEMSLSFFSFSFVFVSHDEVHMHAARMGKQRCYSKVPNQEGKGKARHIERRRRREMEAAAIRRVGFVGLGNMGLRMAKNLIAKRFQLSVHDVRGDLMKELEEKGARIVASPIELVQRTNDGGVDAVVTMLPSNEVVEEVYLDQERGLLASPRDGTATSSTSATHTLPSIMVDASTVAPRVSRSVADAASKRGVHVLDAPVSGGVVGAEAGTLTFMVGGDAAAFKRAEPLMMAMGRRSVHCGGAGSGQAVKLCNNLALAVQMASIAESMNLGQALGIDPLVLAEVMNTSSARCWSSDTYNPVPGVMRDVPAERGYEGGFSAALMVKDIRLALESAVGTSEPQPTPMGEAALELYARMVDAGVHTKDFGGIYEHVYGGGKACAPSKT